MASGFHIGVIFLSQNYCSSSYISYYKYSYIRISLKSAPVHLNRVIIIEQTKKLGENIYITIVYRYEHCL